MQITKCNIQHDYKYVNVCSMHAQSCLTLEHYGLLPAMLLCPWDSPGKNTGVRCHLLLQGIFPTQGSTMGLLHCRQILHCLSHQGLVTHYYEAIKHYVRNYNVRNYKLFMGFPVCSVVKNPPVNVRDMGFPAWEIPWREEPVSYSPWQSKRVKHDLATKQQQQTFYMKCKEK